MKQYTHPQLDVLLVETFDVIRTSGETDPKLDDVSWDL